MLKDALRDELRKANVDLCECDCPEGRHRTDYYTCDLCDGLITSPEFDDLFGALTVVLERDDTVEKVLREASHRIETGVRGCVWAYPNGFSVSCRISELGGEPTGGVFLTVRLAKPELGIGRNIFQSRLAPGWTDDQFRRRLWGLWERAIEETHRQHAVEQLQQAVDAHDEDDPDFGVKFEARVEKAGLPTTYAEMSREDITKIWRML